MKCPICHGLTCDEDQYCFACGNSLGRVRRGEAKARLRAQTPAWAYVLAALCGGIPVAALGGAYPAVVGIGGAFMCLTVARMENVPGVLRFLVCVGITIVAWLIFLTLLVETMPSTKKRVYELFR